MPAAPCQLPHMQEWVSPPCPVLPLELPWPGTGSSPCPRCPALHLPREQGADLRLLPEVAASPTCGNKLQPRKVCCYRDSPTCPSLSSLALIVSLGQEKEGTMLLHSSLQHSLLPPAALTRALSSVGWQHPTLFVGCFSPWQGGHRVVFLQESTFWLGEKSPSPMHAAGTQLAAVRKPETSKEGHTPTEID